MSTGLRRQILPHRQLLLASCVARRAASTGVVPRFSDGMDNVEFGPQWCACAVGSVTGPYRTTVTLFSRFEKTAKPPPPSGGFAKSSSPPAGRSAGLPPRSSSSGCSSGKADLRNAFASYRTQLQTAAEKASQKAAAAAAANASTSTGGASGSAAAQQAADGKDSKGGAFAGKAASTWGKKKAPPPAAAATHPGDDEGGAGDDASSSSWVTQLKEKNLLRSVDNMDDFVTARVRRRVAKAQSGLAARSSGADDVQDGTTQGVESEAKGGHFDDDNNNNDSFTSLSATGEQGLEKASAGTTSTPASAVEKDDDKGMDDYTRSSPDQASTTAAVDESPPPGSQLSKTPAGSEMGRTMTDHAAITGGDGGSVSSSAFAMSAPPDAASHIPVPAVAAPPPTNVGAGAESTKDSSIPKSGSTTTTTTTISPVTPKWVAQKRPDNFGETGNASWEMEIEANLAAKAARVAAIKSEVALSLVESDDVSGGAAGEICEIRQQLVAKTDTEGHDASDGASASNVCTRRRQSTVDWGADDTGGAPTITEKATTAPTGSGRFDEESRFVAHGGDRRKVVIECGGAPLPSSTSSSSTTQQQSSSAQRVVDQQAAAPTASPQRRSAIPQSPVAAKGPPSPLTAAGGASMKHAATPPSMASTLSTARATKPAISGGASFAPSKLRPPGPLAPGRVRPPPLPQAPGVASTAPPSPKIDSYGSANHSSLQYMTPSEVLEAFVDYVPTYFIELRHVMALLPKNLSATVGRGKPQFYFQKYKYFFDIRPTPAGAMEIRLREDAKHPRRGLADTKFSTSNISQLEQEIMKATTAEEPTPGRAIPTGSQVLRVPPDLKELKSHVPEKWTPLYIVEQKLPSDMFRRPFFDSCRGLYKTALRYADHFQLKGNTIRLRPTGIAPGATDEFDAATSPEKGVMEKIMKVLVNPNEYVDTSVAYEPLTVEDRALIRERYFSFAKFLRKHGKSLVVSHDGLRVARFVDNFVEVEISEREAKMTSTGIDLTSIAGGALQATKIEEDPPAKLDRVWAAKQLFNSLPITQAVEVDEAVVLLPKNLQDLLPKGKALADFLDSMPKLFRVWEYPDEKGKFIMQRSRLSPAELADEQVLRQLLQLVPDDQKKAITPDRLLRKTPMLLQRYLHRHGVLTTTRHFEKFFVVTAEGKIHKTTEAVAQAKQKAKPAANASTGSSAEGKPHHESLF